MACLHPKQIKNKHGEYMDVPCGSCYACINNKSFNYTNLCKIEALKHKYVFFVTLTYAPEAIPMARCVVSGEDADGHACELSFQVLNDRIKKYYGTDIIDQQSFLPNRYYV